MALAVSHKLPPALATVYDCLDELAGFLDPPFQIRHLEAELLRCADLVFAGGRSLYEDRRTRHAAVHLFPSSVDVEAFAEARDGTVLEPDDQACIPRPRLGFCGVVDERFDIVLLDRAAAARPGWSWVILGPVVKINERSLPRRPNIHYLGFRPHATLPAYLGGWDVAILPFALNGATRYISPTKTLEYLAAGRPVVSTPIHDVVRTFAGTGLVRIADTPEAFLHAAEAAMAEVDIAGRAHSANAYLRRTSWEATWRAMARLLRAVLEARAAARRSSSDAIPPCTTT